MDFTAFALSQLPPPPARVLEVGCGPEGGITGVLARKGYKVLGVDPRAPEGQAFRRTTLEELDEEPFDAVIAERAFHHVHPLGAAVSKVARMTPLVVLDEFAWDRIDAATAEWYHSQHRLLRASGIDPKGPRDLLEWRREHDDLIPSDVIRAEFGARFEPRLDEPRPYLYRWLNGPATEPLEETLYRAGAIQPIGFRWVGVRRD